MLKRKIPCSLDELLRGVGAGVMSARTWAVFRVLVVGSIRQVGERTITGMLCGSGLAQVVDHKRMHRFFSHVKWCPRLLGCAVADEIIDDLVAGAAVEVAFDGSLYRRSGRKVGGCGWYHDPTANTKKPVSVWGNSFVIAAIIVTVSFMRRPVALPVLADMHDKNAVNALSPSQIARRQLDEFAVRWPARLVYGIADAEFACEAMMRDLLPNVTVTSRLRKNAALYTLTPAPPAKRGRGRPAKKGERLASLTLLGQRPRD